MALLLPFVIASIFLISSSSASSVPDHNKNLNKFQVLEKCSSRRHCGVGQFCSSCPIKFEGSRCVRSTTSNPFNLLNDSLPFNRYAYLTTHNSFAIQKEGPKENQTLNTTELPRVTFSNQEDSITQQLHNGVRALMLDTYDYKGDVWLCHSFLGKCNPFTAFEPLINALKEVEVFLAGNPSEILTIILEDHVELPCGLTKVFKASGLMKYWFPLASMPQDGQDWPLVKHMLAKNHRLIVFTSQKHKQESEGIAYQWNFMVENQYGRRGMVKGKCPKREESAELNDKSISLVLVNHFRTIPIKLTACKDNSQDLIHMLSSCYVEAGNRWANFVAVDFYKRSEGGGSFQAVDMLNGRLLCGCHDLHACLHGSSCRRRMFLQIPFEKFVGLDKPN
ncbi:PI-PLC X domain-containing protein At5g67130-like [Prosopis cineraria]|uniref:PI-PLC X domain-containing protein At5g67130-like n=1 Tax=Prosopis cineraria TaxID=364024 RepID=UPI00240EB58A|nr:PI-PLC X domain-containing protein At5g67130-like [Prosopis cineraria]